MNEFQLVDTTTRHSEAYFSDDMLPDPTPLPGIARWNMLVRPLPVKQKTKSGIYLPTAAKENIQFLQTCGRVVAMGPDCYKAEGVSPGCEVGDHVVWPRGRGHRVMYKGVKYVILTDDDVIMTIPDPSDLDEQYATEK